jgi:ankyrin repeat protein
MAVSLSADFPLLLYATINWPKHARHLSRSTDILDLSLPFYRRKSPSRRLWLKIYRIWKEDYNVPRNSSLLHVASYFGILPLAQNILTSTLLNKAKCLYYINKKYLGKTPLSVAAMNGHVAIVQLLLEKGANTEALDSYKENPLHLAALRGNVAIVQLLLEKGANIKALNENNESPIHLAAKKGRGAIVKLLLEKGANIEALNYYKESLLHLAVRYRHEAIVQLLLENGANIETCDGRGWTLLHKTSLPFFYDKTSSIAQLLLEKGANVDAKNNDGDTPLHLAASYEEPIFQIILLLLEKGADIDITNNKEQTALSIATPENKQIFEEWINLKKAKMQTEKDKNTIDC